MIYQFLIVADGTWQVLLLNLKDLFELFKLMLDFVSVRFVLFIDFGLIMVPTIRQNLYNNTASY